MERGGINQTEKRITKTFMQGNQGEQEKEEVMTEKEIKKIKKVQVELVG